MNWCGYDWITQERWGKIHPTKPISWYDDSAVVIDDNNHLILKTHKNPKYFDELGLTSPIGSGLVSCTEEFGYGYFSIEAVLPKGANLWPAFWMWAWDRYPPEIDILEAYSSKRGSYFNWTHDLLRGHFWRVESNVHLKDRVKGAEVGGENADGTHRYQLGAKTSYWTWQDPTKFLIDYSLLWLPHKVEILYDNKVVRRITDPAVLEQLKDVKMNVIINNFVTADVSLEDFQPSEFTIASFHHIPMSDLSYLK